MDIPVFYSTGVRVLDGNATDGSSGETPPHASTSLDVDHLLRCATPYRHSAVRNSVYYILGIVSCGVLFLLGFWMETFLLKWRRVRCPIDEADDVLVTTLRGTQAFIALRRFRVRREDLCVAVCRRSTCHGTHGCSNSPAKDNNVDVIAFDFLFQTFVLHGQQFANVEFDIESSTFAGIRKRYGAGVQQDEIVVHSLRRLFGECEVVVPSKSSFHLAVSECLQPFYVFQICSVILWLIDRYYWYASAVILLSAGALVLSIRDTCENNNNLQRMARYSCPVLVLRQRLLTTDGRLEELELNSRELVPGDIIRLRRGMKLPCDALLLEGTALVDESMMTGESKPVYKSPIPHENSEHMKHILFGGSVVKDHHVTACALVMRTGYATVQGKMMRALIQNVRSTRLNFEHETWKFVGLLAVISCFSFLWTLTQGIVNDLTSWTIVKRALDTVTIAVPPALPIIVSVGTLCASEALKKNYGTRCLMPSRINVAGRATVVVFDKTGTLTEDDEDLLGVVPTTAYVRPVRQHHLDSTPDACTAVPMEKLAFIYSGVTTGNDKDDKPGNITDMEQVSMFAEPINRPIALRPSMLTALATCHSLSIVDGELIGDALEYQMFRFTGWRLLAPKVAAPDQGDDTEEDAFRGQTRITNSHVTSSPMTTPSDARFNPENYLCVGQICAGSIEDTMSLPRSVGGSDAHEGVLKEGLHQLPRFEGEKQQVHDSHEYNVWETGSLEPCTSPGKLLRLTARDPSRSLMSLSLEEDRGHEPPVHLPFWSPPSLENWEAEKQPQSSLEDPQYDKSTSLYSPSDLGTSREYAILRVFEFDATLQRMSVIVLNIASGTLKLYCKGSPERIRSLCTPSSCPADWTTVLERHNKRGLRVLGIAERDLPQYTPSAVQGLTRLQVENDLIFQGFLLFTNLLRDDSPRAIMSLREAGIGIYMATGDGLVTAAAVAADAGIVPESATTLILGSVDGAGNIAWKRGSMTSSPFDNNGHVNEAAQSSHDDCDPCVTESSSLLHLVEGTRLSQVCLSITGEAFRRVVEMTAQHETQQSTNLVALERFKIHHLQPTRKVSRRFQKGSNDGGALKRWHGNAEKSLLKSRPSTTESTTSTSTRTSDIVTMLPHDDVVVQVSNNIQTTTQERLPQNTITTLEFILRYFQVFGRMVPDDKALLISELQKLPGQPIVAMCGDGANDCAALRRADVGISLSTHEASIAAPFNSAKKSIRVVLDVFREGRGALTNSIQNFQFVALYALIQLCSVMLLSLFGMYLGDRQFLYTDLLVVLPLTYFMSWSKSSSRLHRDMPPETLLAWSIIVSLLGQVVLQVFFQYISALLLLPLAGHKFYAPTQVNRDDAEDVAGYENTVVFLVSSAQTVASAIVLSLGTRPWKRVSRNIAFLAIAGLFTILSFALILNESPFMTWLRQLLQLVHLPLDFRILLLVVVSVNFVSSVLFEEGIVRRIFRRLEHRQDRAALNRDAQSFGDEQVLRCVVSSA